MCHCAGPEAYQSEDIRLLDEETRLGEQYLGKVAALRDECQELQWKRSGERSRLYYPRCEWLLLTSNSI